MHDVARLDERGRARVDEQPRARDERRIHLALRRPAGADRDHVRARLHPAVLEHRRRRRRDQDDDVRADHRLAGVVHRRAGSDLGQTLTTRFCRQMSASSTNASRRSLFGLQTVTCRSVCTRDSASRWLRAWTPVPMIASDCGRLPRQQARRDRRHRRRPRFRDVAAVEQRRAARRFRDRAAGSTRDGCAVPSRRCRRRLSLAFAPSAELAAPGVRARSDPGLTL